MTSISDPRDFAQPVVNFDEPPVKPPPLLLVGPLAWVRQNLISSPLDAILTVLGAAFIVTAVTSFVSWAVGAANWYTVMFNLRLYMVGRYEPVFEWRLIVLLVYVVFAVGMAFAAWGRIPRRTWIVIVVIVALLFILPPVIRAVVPPAPTYLGAGSTEIVSGSSSIVPQDQLAFTARGGETVTLQVADELSGGDEILQNLSGFGDEAANQLRNSAATRLSNSARKAEIEAQLAGDLLTQNQRNMLTTELGKITVAESISDTYSVNQSPVTVRIRRGTTGDVIGETTLDSSSPPFSVTLPEDGWYVLEKTVDGAGDVILRAVGIYPALERGLTQSGGGGAARVSQYVRMTDTFTIEEARPTGEDGNIPILLINDAQFRGTHRFSDYLSLFVGPFFDQINEVMLLIVVILAVGYVAGQTLDRALSPRLKPKRTSGRAATWLLIAAPILMFMLVYGAGGVLPLTDPARWGGLLVTIMLTAVGIIGSFPLGVLLALGRRSSLPVISTFCTLYIEFVRGVPLITVLFMAQLLVPLVNPSLSETPGIFRAMIAVVLFSAAYLAEVVRGGLQSIPPGQEEAAKALGLNGLQITLHITLPQALRAVIPALVGSFISLFKDTSLVTIVGLLDLLGISKNVVAQTEFLQRQRESLLFIVIIYFIFSYSMSTLSKRIEASGAGKAMARKI